MKTLFKAIGFAAGLVFYTAVMAVAFFLFFCLFVLSLIIPERKP